MIDKAFEVMRQMTEYRATNTIYFIMLFLWAVALFAMFLFILDQWDKHQRDSNHPFPSVYAMIEILLAFLTVVPINNLIDSYNAMQDDYYSRAREYYEEGQYQKAKEYYAKIIDFRDSGEKIAVCDYERAYQYLESSDYFHAFSLIGELYSDSYPYNKSKVMGDMASLLNAAVEKVAESNWRNGLYLTYRDMLGAWRDENSRGIYFREGENNWNLFRDSPLWDEYGDWIVFENGILTAFPDSNPDDKRLRFVFFPRSLEKARTEAYVYVHLSGKVLLFTRSDS